MKKILEITKELNIPEEYIIPYGHYMAKIDNSYYDKIRNNKTGKLVLVTACCNAEVAGMGKTSTEIAVNQSLNYLGKNSIACLREPSMGVTWNGKGGATGALNAKVEPEEKINNFFTGDIYALTQTINLIAAQIDNIIWRGNELNIDPERIVWNRAIDICDRSLRNVTVAQDDKKTVPHHCEFVITVAHELSTIMTLATDEEDFINRANKAIVAYTKKITTKEEAIKVLNNYTGNDYSYLNDAKFILANNSIINSDQPDEVIDITDLSERPITVADLKMTNAIRALMHEALMPNIVQSTSGSPVLISATPFGNISVGCSATIATKLAMKLADIVFVENGFSSELSCEKHLDLVLPSAKIKPSAIMAVTSCRSLKYQGGQKKDELGIENVEAVRAGLDNMALHLKHLREYHLPIVVAINKFACDTPAELAVVTEYLASENISFAVSDGPISGETGCIELANKILEAVDEAPETYEPLYSWTDPITVKIEKICKKAYSAAAVEYSDLAKEQIDHYINMGYSSLPVVMCKTPASISDDPNVIGAPIGHTVHIREVRLFAGAGFLVPISGSLLMLPGHVAKPRCLD